MLQFHIFFYVFFMCDFERSISSAYRCHILCFLFTYTH
nr:MAG TPA: hypothetical protein [Caudoviricetes sp.]